MAVWEHGCAKQDKHMSISVLSNHCFHVLLLLSTTEVFAGLQCYAV